jgi:hypothetical protein
MAVVLQNFPIAYVSTPKVASSSIKMMLYELDTGDKWCDLVDRGGARIGIHRWRGHAPNTPLPSLSGYFKFCVVRDPVQRLISAYRNRVVRQRQLHKVDPLVMSRLGLSPDPSLAEFVGQLASYQEASPDILHHTSKQVRFIGRDLSVYSRVFQFEDFDDLEEEVARIAGRLVNLPHRAKSTESTGSISNDLLTPIIAAYRDDYALLEGVYVPPVT